MRANAVWMPWPKPLRKGSAGQNLKVFRAGQPVSLSASLPVLENMGVRVQDERPYAVERADGATVWINDFGLEVANGVEVQVQRGFWMVEWFKTQFAGPEQAEADARGIPIELTEQVNQRFSCMAGTNCANPRCAALDGEVGHKAGCRIYAQRPEPCREVQAGDAQCATARAKYGMGAVGA